MGVGLVLMFFKVGAEEAAYSEALLGVYMNGEDLGQNVMVIREAGGRVFARAEDLRRWRLPVPELAARRYGNADHYPLDAIAGLRYRIDETTQTVHLEAPPEVLLPTVIGGTPEEAAVPTPAAPGGFLNYDLLAEGTEDETGANGLFELGVFRGAGLVLTQRL